LGFDGELRMHFVNQRLRATWFCTPRTDEYIVALQKKDGVHLGKDGEVETDGLRVRRGNQTEGLTCVCWEDVGLTKELDDWVWDNA